MTLKGVMNQLKDFGTEQNVKIYKRHGAKAPLFGVSFANLKKLAKVHKNDTELARKLWATQNTDARTLAMMIANPDELKATDVDIWVRQINYTTLAGYLGALVGRSRFKDSRLKKWMKSNREFVKDTGFSMLSSRLRDGDNIPENDCRQFLKYIEANIHKAPNMARNAMNYSLMAIGIYKRSLTKTAIATAKRIGKVEVDHGETSCKTPDAISYIENAIKRQKK